MGTREGLYQVGLDGLNLPDKEGNVYLHSGRELRSDDEILRNSIPFPMEPLNEQDKENYDRFLKYVQVEFMKESFVQPF